MWIQMVIILLIGAAIAALALRLRGIRTAYIWLTVLVISLIVWVLIIFIPQDRIPLFELSKWFQLRSIDVSLRFTIAPSNFPLIFTVVAYNLSFFLTAVVRLNIRSDLKYWLVQLLQTILAILALSANNTWSLLFAWTSFDILGFFYQLNTSKEELKEEIFRSVIIKFIGSVILVRTISRVTGSNLDISLDNLSGFSQHGFFLAAFLHSGVLPNPIKARTGTPTKRIIDNAFTVMNFVISFSLLTKVTSPQISFFIALPLKFAAYLIMLHFAFQWMTQPFSHSTIIYLLAAASGMIYIFFSSSLITPVYYLILVLLFSISWIGLFTHRSRKLILFPLLFFLMISGLPFTLFSSGVRGFFIGGINIDSIIIAVAYFAILAGFIRNSLYGNNKFDELEPWYQASYLSGAFIFLISITLFVFRNLGSISEELNFWWLSTIGVVISIVVYVIIEKNPKYAKASPKDGKNAARSFFSLNWFFKPIAYSMRKLQSVIIVFSQLLEGDGGILWALVLLFLLISFINPS